MSIRLRLLFSYLAMVLVPIFFVMVSALLVALLYRGDLKELRNIYLPPEHQQKLSQKDQLFIDLQRQSLKNSGLLANQTFLKNLDGELKKSNTALVVRKGKKSFIAQLH
ncbi:hypothetical protein NDK43_12770 [Neobacillus pocheonensis]|uniref:Sensor histidine kinase n=1 Tax=Neobacillus pocheonensis TaxID=363869 RepID=A0ABT0W9U6_9BACI|nr:hypothetical protein [Neobacillus pocheonensis]